MFGLILTPELQTALAFGVLGALLTLVSNLMKRMIPLRIFAMAANAMFIVQATVEHNWILSMLQVTLLTVNAWRLWSIWRTLVQLESARADTSIKEWLMPYMKKKTYKAGTVIFKRGDEANELYYLTRGTVTSPELAGATLAPGALFGEIGIFAKDHRRPVTLVCETDCVMYTMTDEMVHTLYLQNPRIGFYMIRLVVEHLLAQIQRLQPDVGRVVEV